jgi:hypothetical protein
LRPAAGETASDERVLAHLQAMRDVPELIEASRESWRWAR